jgi:formiminotetrahydrofolate cyclodeaminase
MTDMLGNQSVEALLADLASSKPTPGGGSVAALTGAMAAGLVSMVCSIMLKKNQSGDEQSELNALHARAEELRLELQSLAAEDIDVFERLSAAYKLPRTTDADAASRRAAIQKVTRHAAEVPFRTARAAAQLISLCTALAHRCTRLLVSDIGVATTLARACTQSSFLNVEINLAGLEDQNYVRRMRAQIEDLTVGLSEETQGVLEIVLARINE